MFEIISLIEPWMFFVAAIALVAAGVMLGELSVIPWLSIAIFFAGIADFFQLTVQNQLIIFCATFFASVYLSHRYISIAGRQPLIAEVIEDMIGEKVTVTRLEATKSDVGSALSQNGKAWNVRHAKNEMLRIDHGYICTAVSGITLVVSELGTPENI